MTIPQAFQLAIGHHQAGGLAEAEALYRAILAVEPRHADALHLRGVIAGQQGRHEQAVALIGRAIELAPGCAPYHSNLGDSLRELGRVEEAVTQFRLALTLAPRFPAALSNLGFALEMLARSEEALPVLEKAVALDPGLAEARNNLGNTLLSLGRLGEARECFRRALALRPEFAGALNNAGCAAQAAGEVEEAVRYLTHGLALRPGDPSLQNNFGTVLKDLGKFREATEAFRSASAAAAAATGPIRELASAFHSNLIYCLQFAPDAEEVLAEEQRRWNALYAAPLRGGIEPHANNRNPERRLKVGYVSPHFRSQAECYFVLPLFAAHSHADFELHAYSSTGATDDITRQFRGHADVWHEVRGLNDEALARRIRADGIDVLIDLTMHMSVSRLPVFARRPAPVQVSWLAYPGTTGVQGMDYWLTDERMEPRGLAADAGGGEPFYLPDSWCCYDPVSATPDVESLPALSAGHVTFGSLNNFCKINDAVVERWARVLAAAERSRLIMLCPMGDARRRTQEGFARHGIAPERLEFHAQVPRLQYLQLYGRIDLALDPFPYNGITTTCDALWMGVPVLTLPGTRPASRAGLSLLTAAGLPAWVARSEEDYVRLAQEWATDLPRLSALRCSLRARMKASPLMDGAGFARKIEAAYRTMWQRWCGAPPP